MGQLEILDFSTLFLLINPGKVLSNLPDNTTLLKSASLVFYC
jgi:hypothetical protein